MRSRRLRSSFLMVAALGLPDRAPAERAPEEREAVVLVHGLGRSPRSMKRLARRLEGEGFRVVNVGYRSGSASVEAIAERLAAELSRRDLEGETRVHFVTHSLGGIVVRHYLEHRPMENLGRVVMLAPPNRGSELADLMKRVPLLRRHARRLRGQLGTDVASVPNRLGPVDFELGVIAGTRSWNPLFSWVLPGPDDGMVSVERTKVAGMADFWTTPHTHTFMMRADDVLDQTVAFLRNGAFDP